MQLKNLETPLSSRSCTIDPTLIVLHATAGATAKSSIDHLRSVGLLPLHHHARREGLVEVRKDRQQRADHLPLR